MFYRYISPEHVPIQYGGLSFDYCDCNPEFTVDDTATVSNLKPKTKQFVEIICSEVRSQLAFNKHYLDASKSVIYGEVSGGCL